MNAKLLQIVVSLFLLFSFPKNSFPNSLIKPIFPEKSGKLKNDPLLKGYTNVDFDGDGIPDESDNCPSTPNPNQADTNGDGIGDVCDPLFDNDKDGVINKNDNCINYWNANLGITSSNGIDSSDLKQRDHDKDGVGDLCDEDYIILTINENAKPGSTLNFKEYLPKDFINLTEGDEFPKEIFKLDSDNNLKLISVLDFNNQNIYDLRINYESQQNGPRNIVVHVGFSLKEKTITATLEESEYLSSKFNKYAIYDPWINDVSPELLLNFGGSFGGDMSDFSIYDVGLNEDIDFDGKIDLVFRNSKAFVDGYQISLKGHLSNSPVYFKNNGGFNFTLFENDFDNKTIIEGQTNAILIDLDGDSRNEIIHLSEHYHIDGDDSTPHIPLIEKWLKSKNLIKNSRYDSAYNLKPTYYKLNDNWQYEDMFNKIDFTGFEDVFFSIYQSVGGDIDNDGDNDIVFGAQINKINPTIGGYALCILRNDGIGNLKFELYKGENLVNGDFATSEGRMLLEDLNNDGYNDLVFNISTQGNAGKLAFLKNDGAGRFLYELDNIIEDLPQGMRNGFACDIENDGKKELIIFNSSGIGANGYELAGPPNLIKIYNFSNYAFEDVTSKYFYDTQNELDFYSQFVSLKYIDLDGDGQKDLVPKFNLAPNNQGYNYPENAYFGDWNDSKGFQYFRYNKTFNKFEIIDLGEIDRNDIDSGPWKFYYNYNDYDFADLDNDGDLEFYRLKIGNVYHEGINQKVLSGLMIYDFKGSLNDFDGDEVINDFDPCPDVYGLDKGCPDTKAPTLVLKNSHTIVLPASGTSTLEAAVLNNGSTDNVGITQMTLSKTTFTCADIGSNKITFTAKDASGNTSAAEVTVTVVDEIKPTVKVKSGYVIKLDVEGKATLKWEDIDDSSTDNCSIKDKILSKSTFTCADLGTNKITFTAKDASGNTSAAEVTVTVVDDIKPTAKVKSGYVIKLDVQGKATLKWEDIDEGSTDNCSITERKLSKTDFTRTDGGDNKITYTITDASGNTSSIETTVRVDIVLSAPERGNEGKGIKTYPNPVNDYLYLEFVDGISTSTIRGTSLVDASGRVLGEIQLEEGAAGNLGFSTRDLKAGMYFLRLSTRDTLHLIKFTVIH